jgi:hypothetical protein
MTHQRDVEPGEVPALGDTPEYPPYVVTADDKDRWDAAKGIADELFGDQGLGAVWSATRAIYGGPIPS